MLLEQHVAAEQAMQDANAGVGTALREVLEEGITLDGVAELCEIEVDESAGWSARHACCRSRRLTMSASLSVETCRG